MGCGASTPAKPAYESQPTTAPAAAPPVVAAAPASDPPQDAAAPPPIVAAAPPPPPSIPESKIQYVRDIYAKYDSSKLSKLTHDEAMPALMELLGKPEAECEALLNKYDFDQDKRLDMTEFEAMYADLYENDPIGKLFRKYDKSNDGKLQMIEATKAMEELVGPTSRVLIGKFGDADVDGSASLDLTEFTALYHKLLAAPEAVEEAYKAPLPPPQIVAAPPPPPPPPPPGVIEPQ